MSFKRLLLGLSLLSLISCSYFFDDKDKSSNVYNLSISEKADVSCVQDNTNLLRDYFDMKRDDEVIAKDLIEMRDCLNNAIDLFARFFKGTPKSGFVPEDIHKFLSEAFDTYSYPMEFMHEAVRLKDSLIGGTPYEITHEEVRTLPLYINFVYNNLAALSKDRHNLFSEDKSQDWEGFQRSADKLLRVAEEFKTLPRKKEGVFDYASMVRLVNFFLDEDAVEQWTKSFDLINSLQSLIVNGQRDTVNVQKLNFAIDNLAELYIAYMEFNKFLKDETFYTDMSTVFTFFGLVNRIVKTPDAFAGGKADRLLSIDNRILGVLTRATVAAEGRIATSYLNEVIDTLQRMGSMPDSIKGDTLKTMLPQFFGLWLASEGCSQNCDVTAIKTEHIQTLQTFVREWHERQTWINSVRNVPMTRQALRAQRTSSGNLRSFQNSINKVNHLHWEEYVVIGTKSFNFRDLVIFNKIYTLAKLFMRPFNGNDAKSEALDYYLLAPHAEAFYQWFRPLGMEINIIDARSRNSEPAFMEMNLFSSVATEPDRINFAELMEYFEISISTSLRATYLMENEFVDCRIPGLLDIFNYEKLEANCFRQTFFDNNFRFLFSSLPLLNNYLTANNGAKLPDYLNYLERSARQGLIADEPMDTDVLRMSSSITQYAESLFLRFDENNDGVINKTELRKALDHIVPNVQTTIKNSLSPGEASFIYAQFPNFEESLITYMLANKEVPGILTAEINISKGWGIAELKWFKEFTQQGWLDGDVAVNREDIVIVISGLSVFNRVKRIKSLKAIVYEYELDFEDTIQSPNSPIFVKIAKDLNCSSRIDDQVLQWLYDNQKKYFEETLMIAKGETSTFSIFGIEIGGAFSWSRNDIPQTGLFAGWEGAVTYRLIEMVYKDPVLGPLCGVPMLEGVQRISPIQDVFEYKRVSRTRWEYIQKRKPY